MKELVGLSPFILTCVALYRYNLILRTTVADPVFTRRAWGRLEPWMKEDTNLLIKMLKMGN